MIGKCGVKTYPLVETKGVIFIFVGDIDPPPLEYDLAPGFLDEDAVVYCSDPYDIASNWRLDVKMDTSRASIYSQLVRDVHQRRDAHFIWVYFLKYWTLRGIQKKSVAPKAYSKGREDHIQSHS